MADHPPIPTAHPGQSGHDRAAFWRTLGALLHSAVLWRNGGDSSRSDVSAEAVRRVDADLAALSALPTPGAEEAGRRCDAVIRRLLDRLERVRDGFHDEAEECADLAAARNFLAGVSETPLCGDEREGMKCDLPRAHHIHHDSRSGFSWLPEEAAAPRPAETEGADAKPTVRSIIAKLCSAQEVACQHLLGYDQPNDCVCGEGGFWREGEWPAQGSGWCSSGEAAEYVVLATTYCALCMLRPDFLTDAVAKLESAASAPAPSPETPVEPESATPGISDEDLVQRAVRNARPRHPAGSVRWGAVADALAVGSTYATNLCRRFGLDPHEQLPGPTQDGEPCEDHPDCDGECVAAPEPPSPETGEAEAPQLQGPRRRFRPKYWMEGPDVGWSVIEEWPTDEPSVWRVHQHLLATDEDDDAAEILARRTAEPLDRQLVAAPEPPAGEPDIDEPRCVHCGRTDAEALAELGIKPMSEEPPPHDSHLWEMARQVFLRVRDADLDPDKSIRAIATALRLHSSPTPSPAGEPAIGTNPTTGEPWTLRDLVRVLADGMRGALFSWGYAGPDAERCRLALLVAEPWLERGARPEPAGEPEPVAWRYRAKRSAGGNGEWRLVESESDCNPDDAYERQPLYAAPPPPPPAGARDDGELRAIARIALDRLRTCLRRHGGAAMETKGTEATIARLDAALSRSPAPAAAKARDRGLWQAVAAFVQAAEGEPRAEYLKWVDAEAYQDLRRAFSNSPAPAASEAGISEEVREAQSQPAPEGEVEP